MSERLKSATEWLESKYVGRRVFDIAATILPYILGALLLVNLIDRHWLQVVFVGFSSFALCISTFFARYFRNRILRLSAEIRELLSSRVEKLERQNEALRDVALSAVAVMICHERNIPPPFDHLKRKLEAVGTVIEVDVHRAGGDMPPFVN